MASDRRVHPRRVWLLIASVTCVAVLLFVYCYGHLTPSLYEQSREIREGMTIAEVERNLGPGSQVSIEDVGEPPSYVKGGLFTRARKAQAEVFMLWADERNSAKLVIGFREGRVVYLRYFDYGL